MMKAGETSTILQIINGKLSFKCSAQHLRKAREEYSHV